MLHETFFLSAPVYIREFHSSVKPDPQTKDAEMVSGISHKAPSLFVHTSCRLLLTAIVFGIKWLQNGIVILTG